MKKTFKFLISILLTLVFSLCGCTNKDNSDEQEGFANTNYNIVQNGVSDYKIVIPNIASNYEVFAANELQLFLEKSTSCKLDIVNESQVDKSDFIISVGNTSLLAEETSIVVDETKLKDAGLLIKTIDKAVYLTGATGIGTVNAVYEFLKIHVGFKAYAVDCVVYDHYPTLKLLDVDYEYSPSVQFLVSNEQENNFNEEMITNNMRMHITMNVSGSGGFNLDGKLYTMFVHSNDYVISYTDEHKDWFNEKGNQLCYSNEDMIEEFCKRFYNSFVVGKSEPFVMLGVNDFPGSCNCYNQHLSNERYIFSTILLILDFYI